MRTRSLLLLLALSSLSVHAEPPPAVKDPMFNSLAISPQSGEGKWKGGAGLGVTLSRGSNNTTQATLTGEATRAMRDSRLIGRALVIRNSADGKRSNDVANLEARGERNFDGDMFGFGDAMLERDLNNDLRLRQTAGAGIGRRLHDEDGLLLNAYVGVSYAVANYYTASDGRGAEAMLGQDLAYRLSDTSKLSQRLVLVPNSVGPGGVRTALQADITTRITDRFGLQLAVLHKYRENVAAGDAHNDIIVFTGLTSSF